MLRRLALPIGVVLLLAAIVLVSLRLGYLGRVDGGPLRQPTGFDVGGRAAGEQRWTVAVQEYVVDGGRVRIRAARPLLASPGMRIRGPRLHRSSTQLFRAREWPPRGDVGPAVGARLRGDGGLALGIRLRRPGIYLLWRYAIDYDQGARSYRRVTSAARPLCIARRAVCPVDPRLPDPDTAPLGDIGGPSRYPVRIRNAAAAGDPPTAPVFARPGAFDVQVPLTNLTDGRIEVRDLRQEPIRFGGYTLRSQTAESFALGAGESRVVTLRFAGTGCQPADAGTSRPPGLTADVDGEERTVPLLVALTPVPARRC